MRNMEACGEEGGGGIASRWARVGPLSASLRQIDRRRQKNSTSVTSPWDEATARCVQPGSGCSVAPGSAARGRTPGHSVMAVTVQTARRRAASRPSATPGSFRQWGAVAPPPVAPPRGEPSSVGMGLSDRALSEKEEERGRRHECHGSATAFAGVRPW